MPGTCQHIFVCRLGVTGVKLAQLLYDMSWSPCMADQCGHAWPSWWKRVSLDKWGLW